MFSSLKSELTSKKFQQSYARLALFLAFWGVATGAVARLSYATELSQTTQSTQSTWSLIRDRLRVRTFTEMMVPSFEGNTDAVPSSNGGRYAPTNLFNIVWTDYEVAKDFRLFYWQRMIITLHPMGGEGFKNMMYLPRDPRFGVRWTQVFKVPGLNTTYDLFLQPNITDNYISNRNVFEFGFRTNTSYAIPQSRFTLGLIPGVTNSYLFSKGRGPQAYGWAMTWGSYDFNPTFSAQTAITWPFKNPRGASAFDIRWDDRGSAYIQNGIGINVSQQVWMAFFLNNFLFAPVSFKNTWASMWVALTIL